MAFMTILARFPAPQENDPSFPFPALSIEGVKKTISISALH
jgi:hypothetical protein